MRKRVVMAPLIGLVSVMGVLSAGVSATAENWAGSSGEIGCMAPDNIRALDDDHRFYYNDITNRTKDISNLVIQQDINPTDIEATVVFSNPDVTVYDADYVNYCGYNWNSIAGLAECKLANSNGRCIRFEVRLELPTMNALNDNQVSSLLCHEYGHTLGLRHRDPQCMTGDPVFPVNYTNHDRGHINDYYN